MKIYSSLDNKKRKTIILHDTFLYKWWWERLILMMAKTLDADIASWFFSKWSFDLREEWFRWKMIELSSEIFKKWFRHIKLKRAFLFKTKFLKEYETVIFSWDCISAVRNTKKTSKKIYYCHTPPRYLYDLNHIYLSKVPFYSKIFFKIWFFIFKYLYERDLNNIDLILTNSINTKKRIKNFLGLDSEVLYPPVKLEDFKWISQKDYYISVSRLSTAKRIDNIVKAFKQMPDKKLIVIYWINDPQKEEIFEIWKNCKNIEFVTCPWNKGFNEYIWESIAWICIPIDEDFWMVPIESMAAWKPVLGVNEWWLKETIIDKKTGILIDEWWKVEDIIKAIKYLTPEKCLSMRNDCENRAKDFSYDSFEKKIKIYV